jgi:hypothetical protein
MAVAASKGAAHPGGTADKAIAQIVQMNPRRVTVALTLPMQPGRPVVTLEWSREDTTMPLSELLKRIEAYVDEFEAK